jgi:hypothetical protein
LGRAARAGQYSADDGVWDQIQLLIGFRGGEQCSRPTHVLGNLFRRVSLTRLERGKQSGLSYSFLAASGRSFHRF